MDEGYYWVRLMGGEWQVAQLYADKWWCCGSDVGIHRDVPAEVGTKIIRE